MNHVTYFRVSTKKQGESTLGLLAQQNAVLKYLGVQTIIKEFVEIETGTNKKYRPILNEAIELCKKENNIGNCQTGSFSEECCICIITDG